MTGKLYLIPAPLGPSDIDAVIPVGLRTRIHHIRHFLVEKEKPARAYLKQLALKHPLQEIELFNIGKHSRHSDYASFLRPLQAGNDMGLLSDAGCPGIADPGADIVKIAHRKNIVVVPMVGPSSIFLALMASGLNGQNFAFSGYLPVDQNARNRRIRELEALSARTGQAQLFIETPYRNEKLFASLLGVCRASSLLSLAVDLTTPAEKIATKTIAEWKAGTKPNLNKRQVVFILQAS